MTQLILSTSNTILYDLHFVKKIIFLLSALLQLSFTIIHPYMLLHAHVEISRIIGASVSFWEAG